MRECLRVCGIACACAGVLCAFPVPLDQYYLFVNLPPMQQLILIELGERIHPFFFHFSLAKLEQFVGDRKTQLMLFLRAELMYSCKLNRVDSAHKFWGHIHLFSPVCLVLPNDLLLRWRVVLCLPVCVYICVLLFNVCCNVCLSLMCTFSLIKIRIMNHD